MSGQPQNSHLREVDWFSEWIAGGLGLLLRTCYHIKTIVTMQSSERATLKALGKAVRGTYRRLLVGPYRLRGRRKGPMRIVVGSSGQFSSGWIPTDMDYLDITRPEHWGRFFNSDKLDAILAEHVWEHLTPVDAVSGTELCYKFLKPGGYLRLAVPDGLHPDPGYIDRVRPGGSGPGASDHKVLYTYKSLSALLAACGFSVDLLEYFDEQGSFHFKDWDVADGMIHRSSIFDPRNRELKLTYTSVIVDARKERR